MRGTILDHQLFYKVREHDEGDEFYKNLPVLKVMERENENEPFFEHLPL